MMRSKLWLILGALFCFAIGVVATILAMAAGWFDPAPTPIRGKEWGEFLSKPKVELLDDGRKLRLLEDFVYIDPRAKSWAARKDAIVDGASIPQVFWSIVGGPVDGSYRNASIVHDEACVRQTEPSDDVHLMFYEACRCAGLGEMKAKIMYAAVYHFGPSWEIKTVQETRVVIEDGKKRVYTVKRNVAKLIKPVAQPDQAVRVKLEQIAGERNPSLEELKKLDPKQL